MSERPRSLSLRTVTTLRRVIQMLDKIKDDPLNVKGEVRDLLTRLLARRRQNRKLGLSND